MRKLEQYIASNNRWNAIFGKPAVTFPLSQHSVDQLAENLNSQLEPENLYCDGELSPAQGQAKQQELVFVANQLSRYCKINGLAKPLLCDV